MTWVRNDLKWSVCRWTCMSLFSRGAMCVPLDDQENIICTLPSHIATRTMVAIYEGRVHVRIAICEGNGSVRLHIAASWYCTCFSLGKQKRLWPLVGGAHPYIPNMLQNSCRNCSVSYAFARWSYCLVLIPYYKCRSISYYVINQDTYFELAQLQVQCLLYWSEAEGRRPIQQVEDL